MWVIFNCSLIHASGIITNHKIVEWNDNESVDDVELKNISADKAIKLWYSKQLLDTRVHKFSFNKIGGTQNLPSEDRKFLLETLEEQEKKVVFMKKLLGV